MATLHEGKSVTLFKILPGDALWDVAKAMSEWAQENRAECIVIFNGRAMHAKPGTTDRELLLQFDSGMKQLFNTRMEK